MVPVERVFTFAVKVTAGTARATPSITATAFTASTVTRVTILIPDGVNAQAGVGLGLAGVRILPEGSDQWWIGNDEQIDTELDLMPNSGAWQVHGWNTGTFDHTFQVRFYCVLLGLAPTVMVPGVVELAPVTVGGPTSSAQAAATFATVPSELGAAISEGAVAPMQPVPEEFPAGPEAGVPPAQQPTFLKLPEIQAVEAVAVQRYGDGTATLNEQQQVCFPGGQCIGPADGRYADALAAVQAGGKVPIPVLAGTVPDRAAL